MIIALQSVLKFSNNMKKFYLLILFISSAAFSDILAQNKVMWNNWEQAIEKSQNKKKKIIVDIYTDWCGWCKKMDKSTYTNNQIAKYINENYYAVRFNAESKNPINFKGHEFKLVKNGNREYHELAAYLLQGKLSYPCTVILDEDFNLIQAIPGFQNCEVFEKIISYFGTDSHKHIPWNKFTEHYNRLAYFQE